MSALDRYGATAQRASDRVIAAYSTSFGAATRLLGRRHRAAVRSIYALVRVADELVDGVGAEAGLSAAEQRRALDALEADTERAIACGYSANPIVHAFAAVARESGIDRDLTAPFFASMRADLDSADGHPLAFDDAAHGRYVYGSAEVVGLMCLRVFLRAERHDADTLARIEHGARRLGAAFQNVNFLRDLADDTAVLQRSYLSGTGMLTEDDRDRWVALIRAQLSDASAVIGLLPRDARAAVRSAHDLFSALTDRIAATSVPELLCRRVRVPDVIKAAIVLRAAIAEHLPGRRR